MFGKIKCARCGTVLDGNDALKDSGNLFCSEECSEEYRRNSRGKEGCCCC